LAAVLTFGSAGAFVLVGLIVATSVAAIPSPAADALFGHNLVVNGDGELDVGADDETLVVKPKGWTTTGQFTVFQFGGISGFPTASDPGPPNRGKNFFTGGDAHRSTATQIVSVAGAARPIDAGRVAYTFSGWLGGYEEQGDYAMVTADFLSVDGVKLDAATLGPVTAADRHNRTGLFLRVKTGPLPRGTRSVRVTITATRLVGASNDGYSDDISLVLSRSKPARLATS
jgi:hypothetical protein